MYKCVAKALCIKLCVYLSTLMNTTTGLGPALYSAVHRNPGAHLTVPFTSARWHPVVLMRDLTKEIS